MFASGKQGKIDRRPQPPGRQSNRHCQTSLDLPTSPMHPDQQARQEPELPDVSQAASGLARPCRGLPAPSPHDHSVTHRGRLRLAPFATVDESIRSTQTPFLITVESDIRHPRLASFGGFSFDGGSFGPTRGSPLIRPHTPSAELSESRSIKHRGPRSRFLVENSASRTNDSRRPIGKRRSDRFPARAELRRSPERTSRGLPWYLANECRLRRGSWLA